MSKNLDDIMLEVTTVVDGITGKVDGYDLTPEQYQWFIQQASRVEELEKTLEFMEKQRNDMGESHQQTILDSGKLLKQNQRYRKLLETFSDTSKIASKIKKEYPDIGMIGPNELLQWITENAEKALEREPNDDYEVSKC